MPFNEKKQPLENAGIDELPVGKPGRWLVLHNDEVNTFEYVIESLVEVCEHDQVQAEQCTFIVHYKGKCDVKNGSFTSLKPIKDELARRGLTVTID